MKRVFAGFLMVLMVAMVCDAGPLRSPTGISPTTPAESADTLLNAVTSTGDGTAVNLGPSTAIAYTCSVTLGGTIPTNVVTKLKGSIDGIVYDDFATDTFTPTEKVADGTFTGSLAASWTAGVGWAYSANNVAKTAGAGTLSQATASMTSAPVAGEYYLLNFTISGWSAGAPTVTVGGATGTGTAVSADGIYTRIIAATANTGALTFTPATTDDAYTIDTISMIRNEHLFHVVNKPAKYYKASYVSKSGGDTTTSVTVKCVARGVN